MMDTNDLADFIKTLLVRKGDNTPLASTDRLISSGRLDSVDVMEIVVFLEQRFDLDFSDRGIDLDDFDSLNTMQTMINELAKPGGKA